MREQSRWRAALRRYATQKAALAGAVGLALLVAACFLVPAFSPYDPNDARYEFVQQSPSTEHPLGTDQHGRDVLTRLALGGQASMLIAAAATAIILVLGLVYGAAAGFAGGRVDDLMMRLLDGLFAIPRLPAWIIILVLIGTGGNILTLVFTLSILGWMTTARLVRGEIASLKQNDFVRAARALGATPRQIVVRHLMPNTLGVLVVAVLLELPVVILGEAFVSLLGLGLNAPRATWGNIAQDGLYFAWPYLMLLPSLAIAWFAICANFVADGVHSALDPRQAGPRDRGGLDRVVRAAA